MDAETARLMEAAFLPTLVEVARHHAAVRPDAVALEFDGATTTYLELDRRSDAVAAGLVEAGVRPGDRIAYLGKNSDVFFELLFGASKAGVVLVPLGWRLAPSEIADMIADSGAQVVFVGPDGGDQFRKANIAPAHVLRTDDGAYAAWRDEAPTSVPDHRPRPTDVVLQLYTSGTTGRPKGVMLTHDNLQAAKRLPDLPSLAWNRWEETDVCLDAMPVSHIAGANWGLTGLVAGATTIMLRDFSAEAVLDAIEHRGVSKLFLVPAALRLVLADPRSRRVDYSRLRHVLYGASPIPLELLRECVEVFGCGFCQQYGMTETAGTIVYLPPEDHAAVATTRMRAAGLPLPGVELRIVDGAGATLGSGEVGEILVRSPMNMAGYWGRQAETSAILDQDGWLRTGDAGYVDADGYLFIHDRVKDMIITGGENVYPAEVECVLFGHPGIADVAVIGVPDERWGEAVKAIVVAHADAALDEDQIIDWARSWMARFKVPKTVDFVDALPRNASGKILRRELRAPQWAACGRQVN